MNNPIPEIDIQSAFEAQSAGVILVDVRETEEYEAGHALGALSIPLSELTDRIGELDTSVELNIICKSGKRSAQAAAELNEIGYKATNVMGGSLEWFTQKLPFVSDNNLPPTVI